MLLWLNISKEFSADILQWSGLSTILLASSLPCLVLPIINFKSGNAFFSVPPQTLSRRKLSICFLFQQINTGESSSKTCDLRQFKNNKSFQRAVYLHCSMSGLASYQLAWSSLSLALAIRWTNMFNIFQCNLRLHEVACKTKMYHILDFFVSIYLFKIWKYHEGLKHSFNSSYILQGFKSMQLRMVGPGLVGLGILLTFLRVLLCIVPPYVNRCRQGRSWNARKSLTNKNVLQAGEGEERDQENWWPKTSRPCPTAVLYRLVVLSYKQDIGKVLEIEIWCRELSLLKTFIINLRRFHRWRECVATWHCRNIFTPC